MVDIRNDFDSKKCCVGCAACEQICPVKAVSLVSDAEGFVYPKINKELCVKCDKCERVCPVLNVKTDDKKWLHSYSAVNKNEEERINSSSGGIFVMLAGQIINEGGVVYGAAFSEDYYSVNHIRVDCVDDLRKLQQSKYVQSSINDHSVFKDVKIVLEKGKEVLFSGTPCQIEGLKCFLGKEYPNLYTVDFICHGVPSPKVWEKYIKESETEYKSKAVNVSFRNKQNGWRNFSVRVVFENGSVYTTPANDDLYMRAFLKNISLRPSCYSCRFKKLHRESDLTLADFWGIERFDPDSFDDKGISLVVIHSESGVDLWRKINNGVTSRDVELNDIIKYNPMITKSVNAPEIRKAFFRSVKRSKQVYKVLEKYNKKAEQRKPSLWARVIIKCKIIIKRLIGRDH